MKEMDILNFDWTALAGNFLALRTFEPASSDSAGARATIIEDCSDLDRELRQLISKFGTSHSGLLLSGGIDSAIIASYLPENTDVFTIQFDSVFDSQEADFAAHYSQIFKLNHHIVKVSWQDYLSFHDLLSESRRSPLHPIEVPLYKAALAAAELGIKQLFVGNGADSNFGGMDKLLANDYTLESFCKRYFFVDPKIILRSWTDEMVDLSRFGDSKFDVISFLRCVHGAAIDSTFHHAIESAGLSVVAPFEEFRPAYLDLERVRTGDPKYIIRQLFEMRYPDMRARQKVPFARPMQDFMNGIDMPTARIFHDQYPWSELTGDQKFLVWSLSRFLSLVDP